MHFLAVGMNTPLPKKTNRKYNKSLVIVTNHRHGNECVAFKSSEEIRKAAHIICPPPSGPACVLPVSWTVLVGFLERSMTSSLFAFIFENVPVTFFTKVNWDPWWFCKRYLYDCLMERMNKMIWKQRHVVFYMYLRFPECE